jgi:hypothetical protein
MPRQPHPQLDQPHRLRHHPDRLVDVTSISPADAPRHLVLRPSEEYRSVGNGDVRALVEENGADAVDEVLVEPERVPPVSNSL